MEPTPSHPSPGEHRASTTASVWRPLRGQTFRNLLIADIFSDVGTFMQSVGAAWLMVSLKGWANVCRAHPNGVCVAILPVRFARQVRWVTSVIAAS